MRGLTWLWLWHFRSLCRREHHKTKVAKNSLKMNERGYHYDTLFFYFSITFVISPVALRSVIKVLP